MRKKAIIIGSGIAGLASAIRLSAKGIETHIFEANSFPGGKINSKTINGYRFDQGPSLLTCPQYIEDLYKIAEKDFSSFKMAPLKTSFKYFYTDGTCVELNSDRKKVIEELATKLEEDPEMLRRYLNKSEQNYNLISPLFIEKSLHRWPQLFGKKLVKALVKLPQYRLMHTMDGENRKYFKNPRTRQIFNRFAQYNGSHPHMAPAMLNMISHLEINTAPFLPARGMIQITEELVKIAEDLGVTFHFNESVERIEHNAKSVEGVTTNVGSYKADYVVSNMDIFFTYNKLLPTLKKPEKILSQEKSSSVLAFHWGIKGSFPALSVHNMFFSDNDKEEFDAVFIDKDIHESPSFYLYISSKAVEADAPIGCENWFVLINAPVNRDQDWDQKVKEMKEYVIKRMNATLDTQLLDLIEVEEILTPQVIEAKYQGKDGSIYGNASNNRFSAFYRHSNYSKQLKGLYFAGVSVHPGGGIPLALNSAKIACECLFRDEGL